MKYPSKGKCSECGQEGLIRGYNIEREGHIEACESCERKLAKRRSWKAI